MTAAISEPLRGRLARNTGWSICGSVLSQGSSLVAAILVGRFLGVATLGRLALIQTTILLFGTIGELGLSLTITKFVSRWEGCQSERAGSLIGSAIGIAGLCCGSIALLLGCCAPYIHPLGFQEIPLEFRTGCVLLIFESLNRVQIGALAGFEAFFDSARVNVVRGVFTLPAAWVGIQLGGLEGVLIALVFVSSLCLLLGHFLVRRHCQERRICLRYFSGLEKEVIATSFSLWASMLLLFGSTWLATLLLSRHVDGNIQLGLFNAAEKWKSAVLFVPNMLFQVTLPMLSQSYAAGDRRASLRVLGNSISSAMGVAVIGAIFLFAFAGPLMSSYGGEFAKGRDVLSLAAWVAVLNAFYTVASSGLWAVGKPFAMLRIDLARTVVLVGICAFGFASDALRLNIAFLLSYAVGGAALLYSMIECFSPILRTEPA